MCWEDRPLENILIVASDAQLLADLSDYLRTSAGKSASHTREQNTGTGT